MFRRKTDLPGGATFEDVGAPQVESDADSIRQALEGLHERITSLENSRKHLKQEVIRLKSENFALKESLSNSVNFFEHRVDQIYARLLQLRPQTLDRFIQPDSIDGDELPAPKEAWKEAIAQFRQIYIGPTVLKSPLTLWGIRLNTLIAVERLTEVEFSAGRAGIGLFGPYKRMLPLSYKIVARCGDLLPDGGGNITIEVSAAKADRVIARDVFPCVQVAASSQMAVPFVWDDALEDDEVEFRIHTSGHSRFSIREIALQEN